MDRLMKYTGVTFVVASPFYWFSGRVGLALALFLVGILIQLERE